MALIYEIIGCFLKAWMHVTTDLYLQSQHAPQKFADWTDRTIVFMSILFFYMVCYLIHKNIEDWVKIQQIKKSRSKLIDYDDHTD